MVSFLTRFSLLGFLALAMLGTPDVLRAQNTTATNKPIAIPSQRPMPFRGKLTAVSTGAQTITLRTQTLQITPETKITKDGKPATLADGVIGETVSGRYKRTADGKFEALMVNFGMKPAKPAAPASNTRTNAS